MNEHNTENDPLEDMFRDRFDDFESESDIQLWQKIESQLLVNPTRKSAYWQTSVIIILLLVAALWIYHEKHSDNLMIKSDTIQKEQITKADHSQKERNPQLMAVVSPKTTDKTLRDELSIKTTVRQGKTTLGNLTMNELTDNSARGVNIKPRKKIIESELRNTVFDESKGKFLPLEKVINDHKTSTSSLISRPNTTFDLAKTHANKSPDKSSSKDKITGLKLSTFENYQETKLPLIIDDLSNQQSVSSVFSQSQRVAVLNKNYSTFIDSKSYNLFSNHFKKLTIQFVTAPPRDNYFKERKPLEIYASMMPLLNYYTITPNGNDANYVHNIAVSNDNRLGFFTQAGLLFTISDRFKLRTGLTFTKTNHSVIYQIRTDSLIVHPPDKSGIDVNFEEKKATYSQVANYIGTKIEVQYIIKEGRDLSHYVNFGLEGSYRLNGLKQANGFLNIAYGITRQIGDKAYLFVEPTYSYSLNQQNDDGSFLLVKPNKIGFNIGVNFKIK